MTDHWMEAELWEAEEGGAVRCRLCAHRCRIPEGHAGICQVRRNRDGRLLSMVRNRLISSQADPIEKKPLYHFLPGSLSLSIATVGCNFRCDFCQNWQISQYPKEGRGFPGQVAEPVAVVREALRASCRSISYTYTEPTIFFETCRDVGVLAREAGLKNVFVTNGYLTQEAVEAAGAFLDAANVDLKGFDDAVYRKVCGASLQGVLEGIDALFRAGVWLEITTLLVPGMNDSEAELRALARWIRDLNQDIPWHISRFHPDFKMTGALPTPVESLRRAARIGREQGLRFVYLGNVPLDEGENTFCPRCEKMVVSRRGFSLGDFRLREGRCGDCGAQVPGFWE